MDIGFIKSLQAEWPTVSAAPWSVAIVAFLAFSAGFGITTLYWGGTVSTLRERVRLYQDKLNGATPDQVKAKLDELAEMTRYTVGAKWTSLTTAEITNLSTKFATLTKRRIQVMYSNYRGKDLAQSFVDALKQAGWTDIHYSEGGGLGMGVSTGRGNGIAIEMKKAIEEATTLKVGSLGPDETGDRGLFIAVGINSK